jgi:signal transduction histidine kinase
MSGRGDLEVAHDSALVLLDLINDLLDFSKLGSTQLKLELVAFDVAFDNKFFFRRNHGLFLWLDGLFR